MSTAIFNAACKTYTWMRDHMNTKLQDALDDQEVAYYNKLVETATLPDIYDKTAGKAKPDYTPGGKIGPTIIANVKSRQKDVFQSTAFGFEEMTP
jgi:hypothetical protein